VRSHSERLDSLAKRLRVQANDLRFDNFLSFIYTSEIVNKYLDNELSRRITRSKHATTKAVDSLEMLGLTKSARTKRDRRLRKVSITERGLDLVEQTMSLRHTIGSQAMQCLDQEEAESFQTILRRFRKHMIQLMEENQAL